MRAALWTFAGALVVISLGAEVFVARTGRAQTTQPAMRIVQSEPDAAGAPAASIVATPQHPDTKRAKDRAHRKLQGNGESRVSAPTTVPLGGSGPRTAIVSTRPNADKSTGSLGPINQMPRPKSVSHATSTLRSAAPSGTSIGTTTTSRSFVPNLSVQGLGPIYQMPHPSSGPIPKGENSGNPITSTGASQSSGNFGATPLPSLLRGSSEPTGSNGAPSNLSSVSPSSTIPSVEGQPKEGSAGSAAASPSTAKSALPSWVPGDLETTPPTGSLKHQSPIPDSSNSSRSISETTPRSNQASSPTVETLSKIGNVDPFIPNIGTEGGVSIGSQKMRDLRGVAGNLATGSVGDLTESVGPAATSADSAPEASSESKSIAELSPLTATTPRPVLPQSEGTAPASEVTGVQGDIPRPTALLTPAPSSPLGSVTTSPVLFLLPFFPLLLLVYFGLRLS